MVFDFVDGVNVSIDTFSPSKFHTLTGANALNKVLQGIQYASDVGVENIKINMVAIKDFTESELYCALNFIKDKPIQLRFIELMPIGLGKTAQMISLDELKQIIENKFGKLELDNTKYGNGPAIYYNLAGFVGKIGFISAVTHSFCKNCNRIRMTSDGYLKYCLHHSTGLDLYELLQKPEDEIVEIVTKEISYKPEQHDFVNQTENSIEFKEMYKIGG